MKWYTTTELAEKFQVEKNLTKSWRRRNKFPNAVKKDGRWLVPESDLEGFIPQRRRGRAFSDNPSEKTLYERRLRARRKERAAAGAPPKPLYGYKDIDENRGEICRLYREKKWTLQQIADHFKISISPVRSRLIRAGIKLRTSKPRRRLDRETLQTLYVEKKLPLSEIAKRLKTTYRKVCEELARHGIEKR